MAPLPENPRREPHLSHMPFTVIKQIIPLLPIDSLASLVRTSIRYAALANTSEFKKSMFIDGPPAPPPPHIRASLAAAQKLPDATNIDFIHPIFSRLYFMPTNPVQTVKLGSASSQLYLGTTKVKDCYATRPAVKELWFRIVGTKLPSGNRWDVRFRVGNEMGVTVWDLVRRLTAFLAKESDPPMSFGIWYGKEHCEAKGLDPEIVMTSFEFLEKELTTTMLFARFWMVNPGARNEIVCDIGFSRWVAQYEDYMRDQIMAKQLALVNLDDQHHRSKLLADITAKSRPDLISDCSEADEQDSDHETRPEEWKRPYVEPAVKQKLTKYVPPKKVFHEKPRQVFNGPEVDEWKSVPYPSELIEAADDGSADYGVGATAAAKAAQTAATGRPAGGAWGTWSGDTAKTRDQWKAFMELKHKR